MTVRYKRIPDVRGSEHFAAEWAAWLVEWTSDVSLPPPRFGDVTDGGR